MADQIELTLLGFASVVDTVLLLVMFERVNRPIIPVWIATLLLATWTWHVGSFAHVFLRDSVGELAIRADCTIISAMAGGLLVLPGGFLHGALRLRDSGAVARPPSNPRYAVLYAPVLLLVPVSIAIFQSGSRDFLQSTESFHVLFLTWLTLANLSAATIFWTLRNKLQLPGSHSLLLQMTSCLVVITGLAIVYPVVSDDSTSAPWLRIPATMSLLVPTLCFFWSIFHRRLMPLMLERTLGYGAILIGILWLHRVVMAPVTDRLTESLNLDFVLIEFVAVLVLVLAWQPLRNRVREGLRYLMGTDVSQAREATRHLSSQLLLRSGDRVEQTMEWFAEAVRTAMQVESVWVGLSPDRFFHATVKPTRSRNSHVVVPPTDPFAVYQIEFPNNDICIDQTRCRDVATCELLRTLHASAAFQFTFKNIHGRLLLGRLDSGDRFSTEQLHSLAMLLDEFAVTVHNRELEEARRVAERRAMQQEKLSVLGLLSGSLAHELKNPLSSIKTISTLLMEELAESSGHHRDIQLIVSEIDRLTETTNGLLQYSRPANSKTTSACVELVIERLLNILRYLAQQTDVTLITDFQANDRFVCGSEATLSEIFFNLIKNAIEAASQVPEASQVTIETRTHDNLLTVRVCDNGPGIPVELHEQLFEPFVTGKEEGTGLGLYLVAERVRETGGTIQCSSHSTEGTEFRVTMPVRPQDRIIP
ncbi:MAG: ATP-binding protein [Planctomycetaceae bacterium]